MSMPHVQPISKDLLHEYEAVRRSGATNMLDYKAVNFIASGLNLINLAEASSTPQKYGKLLMAYVTPNEDEFQAWMNVNIRPLVVAYMKQGK